MAAIDQKSKELVGNTNFGHRLLDDFLFDKSYRNLNHGSFGTYPRQMRDLLRRYQDQAEAKPDVWIRWDALKALDESRQAIADCLNVSVDTCVFIQNATTGINTVLRNLVFEPKDVIVYFDTIYGACERSVRYITETTPAESAKVRYRYPVSDEWLVDEFSRVVKEQQSKGANVRIAIFDTIVSMPGVRMPFEALAKACKDLGVLSCIDGAHGVGQIELDLASIDPDFFVSNCHKWLYVPRGCAVFYVPVRNQHLIRSTLPTSHGFQPRPKPGELVPNNPLPPSSKAPFITNFEFVGTVDTGPYLCVAGAIKYRQSLGGERAIMSYCQTLAREGAKLAAEIMGTEVLENEEGTLGNCFMTNARLPLELKDVQRLAGRDDVGFPIVAWANRKLVDDYGTFMQLMFYGEAWWVRFSSQIYLELSDYEWAARTLLELCGRVAKGEFLEVEKPLEKL